MKIFSNDVLAKTFSTAQGISLLSSLFIVSVDQLSQVTKVQVQSGKWKVLEVLTMGKNFLTCSLRTMIEFYQDYNWSFPRIILFVCLPTISEVKRSSRIRFSFFYANSCNYIQVCMLDVKGTEIGNSSSENQILVSYNLLATVFNRV